jgi:hypothetical protein
MHAYEKYTPDKYTPTRDTCLGDARPREIYIYSLYYRYFVYLLRNSSKFYLPNRALIIGYVGLIVYTLSILLHPLSLLYPLKLL